MSDERDRIDRLMQSGSLTPQEGRDILAALAFLEQAADGSPAAAPAKPNRAAHAKARFVRGEISEEQFLTAGRRASVQMGVLFGVLMTPVFLFMPELIGRPLPGWFPIAPLSLATGLFSGVLFGMAMHHFFVRPATRRLARLLRQVKTPLPPVQLPRAGQCPTCGAENVHSRDIRDWMMLHWVLNPGLAVNELVFGQRIPAVLRECRECGTSFSDCESCDSAIEGNHWSGRKAFGHWRGLRCPRCRARLPCLRNGLAYLLTLPLKPFVDGV